MSRPIRERRPPKRYQDLGEGPSRPRNRAREPMRYDFDEPVEPERVYRVTQIESDERTQRSGTTVPGTTVAAESSRSPNRDAGHDTLPFDRFMRELMKGLAERHPGSADPLQSEIDAIHAKVVAMPAHGSLESRESAGSTEATGSTELMPSAQRIGSTLAPSDSSKKSLNDLYITAQERAQEMRVRVQRARRRLKELDEQRVLREEIAGAKVLAEQERAQQERITAVRRERFASDEDSRSLGEIVKSDRGSGSETDAEEEIEPNVESTRASEPMSKGKEPMRDRDFFLQHGEVVRHATVRKPKPEEPPVRFPEGSEWYEYACGCEEVINIVTGRVLHAMPNEHCLGSW